MVSHTHRTALSCKRSDLDRQTDIRRRQMLVGMGEDKVTLILLI